MSDLPTYQSTGGGTTCEDDCNCPGCSPAGDLFVPPSEVNPRRRIIRARRPPQSDPSLTNAIGFLQQANNNNSLSTTTTATATRGGGTQRSGEVSDSDDESMPPLEDIDNTAANPATLNARRGRNNGSNRTGNRFGALGEY